MKTLAFRLGVAWFVVSAPAVGSTAAPRLRLEVPPGQLAEPTFVVLGRAEPHRIWTPDAAAALAPEAVGGGAPGPSPSASERAAVATEAPPAPRGELAASTQEPASMVFLVPPAELAACVSTPRFRETSFVVGALRSEVTRIEIEHGPSGGDCARLMARELAARSAVLPVLAERGDSPSLRVRIRFKPRLRAASAGSAPPPLDTGAGPSEQRPDQNPLAPSSDAAASRVLLFVDDRPVAVQPDGWFAAVVKGPESVTVEARRGGKTAARLQAQPLFLRLGDNVAYTNELFAGVTLASGPRLTLTLVPSARAHADDSPALSLPFIFKVATGYTALLPVPEEGARDRPTVEGALRTHPLIGEAFLVASASLSLKTSSKVPWAVVGLAMLGQDLVHVQNNLSVPVALGVRLFRSRVNGEESGADGNPGVTIPRAVLGPAAQAGLRYRSGLLQVDASGVVAPLKVADAPVLVSYDATLTVGYQVTPEDTVVLGSRRHDVRFPTTDGFVKIVAASVTLGYERDLY